MEIPFSIYLIIPSSIFILLVGLFVLVKDRKQESRLFFFLAFAQFLWSLIAFIVWQDSVFQSIKGGIISDLPISRIEEFFTCISKLLIEYRKSKIVKQVAIFHNKGEKAGASQPHPHYQALTLPIIEREYQNELNNLKNYYNKNKKCLHCEINKIEKQFNKRIIAENNDFIAFCPFAPKVLFQAIISPKRHMSSFEQITEEEKKSLSKIFKKILLKYDYGFDISFISNLSILFIFF
jgi:galactose-1-phosphate uridylyltransferase